MSSNYCDCSLLCVYCEQTVMTAVNNKKEVRTCLCTTGFFISLKCECEHSSMLLALRII